MSNALQPINPLLYITPHDPVPQKVRDASRWFAVEIIELDFGDYTGRPSAAALIRVQFLSYLFSNGWYVDAVMGKGEGGKWKSVNTSESSNGGETRSETTGETRGTSSSHTTGSSDSQGTNESHTDTTNSSTTEGSSNSNTTGSSSSRNTTENSASGTSSGNSESSSSSTSDSNATSIPWGDDRRAESHGDATSESHGTATSETSEETNTNVNSESQNESSTEGSNSSSTSGSSTTNGNTTTSNSTSNESVTEGNTGTDSKSLTVTKNDGSGTTTGSSEGPYWFAYVRLRLKRRKLQAELVMKDMVADLTNAYNEGRKINDDRYDELVSLYAIMLGRTEGENNAFIAATADFEPLTNYVLQTMKKTIADFHAVADNLPDDVFKNRVKMINLKFDNEKSTARAQLITTGLYNSSTWITTEAGIERNREMALNDLIETKIDVYVKVANAGSDIGSRFMESANRMMQMMKERSIDPSKMRNDVFKWMLDFMERRKDEFPALEQVAGAAKSLGYGETTVSNGVGAAN